MDWALRFDLGEIRDTKYGSLLNTKGEVSLLTGTSYKIPSLAQDKERLYKISNEIATQYRYIHPKKTDAEAAKLASHCVLLAAYHNPKLEWDDGPSLRYIVTAMVAAFAADDIVDSVFKIQNGVANFKFVLQFGKAFGRPDMDLNKFFPGFRDNPNSPLYNLGITLTLLNETLVQVTWGRKEALKFFQDQWLLASIGNFFTLSSKESNSTKFSFTNYNRHVAQHTHAMRVTLGANVFVNQGTYLPQEVAETLLFQMLLDSFGNATALINAIFGLKKDLKEDSWPDTCILRGVVEKGITLQEAFDETVAELKNEIRDMNLALEILYDAFGDEEGFPEWLEVLEDTFMGTALVYADERSTERYIGTSIQVIKTSPPKLYPIKKPEPECIPEHTVRVMADEGAYLQFNPEDPTGEIIVGNTLCEKFKKKQKSLSQTHKDAEVIHV